MAGRIQRPAGWAEVEITIAAATPAPIAHVVSKKWVMIDADFDAQRLSTRTSDFDFLVFLLIIASLICSPRNRKAVSRTTRTSAAVGFEPTPTPEAEEFKEDRLLAREIKAIRRCYLMQGSLRS